MPLLSMMKGANSMTLHSPRYLECLALAGLIALSGCQAPPPLLQPIPTPAVSATPTTPMPSSPVSTLLATPSDTEFTPPAGSPLVPMYEDGSGPFVFGMTMKQFYQRAEQLGWTWDPASGLGEHGWVWTSGGALFRFSEDRKMDALQVSKDSLQTERGFRIGDSRQRLFELYGTDYENQGGGGVDVYEFRLPGGLYFTASFERSKDRARNWSYWRET